MIKIILSIVLIVPVGVEWTCPPIFVVEIPFSGSCSICDSNSKTYLTEGEKEKNPSSLPEKWGLFIHRISSHFFSD